MTTYLLPSVQETLQTILRSIDRITLLHILKSYLLTHKRNSSRPKSKPIPLHHQALPTLSHIPHLDREPPFKVLLEYGTPRYEGGDVGDAEQRRYVDSLISPLRLWGLNLTYVDKRIRVTRPGMMSNGLRVRVGRV